MMMSNDDRRIESGTSVVASEANSGKLRRTDAESRSAARYIRARCGPASLAPFDQSGARQGGSE